MLMSKRKSIHVSLAWGHQDRGSKKNMKINYDPVSNYKVEWTHVRDGSGELCITNVRGKERLSKNFFLGGDLKSTSLSQGLSLYETVN